MSNGVAAEEYHDVSAGSLNHSKGHECTRLLPPTLCNAMASKSPDSPSKKRKQPTDTNLPKRDQPLFASRRPAPTLQQPPDFLTDSLNTSYIPSPSPDKSPTRASHRAKPRQAGSRTSLTEAFKATGSFNNENKPLYSTASEVVTRRRKPIPTPASTQASAHSDTKKPRSSTHTRTPTPPRGRQVTALTSPTNSESSPGRGYAEAYQRIVEEENLAQEESIDGLDMDDLDHFQGDESGDINQSQLQRIHNSASPSSRKASRRASPQANGAMKPSADEAENKENITDGVGSDAGNTNEDVTLSSVDSGSSQHARDLQRLNIALRSGQKAFSKARLGERGGPSMEILRRRNGSDESLRSTQSTESFSHRGSDAGVNNPKAWGRKARPGNDWLSRINDRSGRLTGDVSKRHSSSEQMIAVSEKRSQRESVDDWIAAAAEVPLPGGGNGSSLITPSSKSTPTTTHQQPLSVDRRQNWEIEDDFTGRSLQVSESPPIHVRNTTLDRFRDREIELLEKQAVTTSRLGKIREKTSEEQMYKNRSSPDRLLDTLANTRDSAIRRRASDQLIDQSKSRNSRHAGQEPGGEEAGEAIPDTPVIVYRSKSSNSTSVDETGIEQIPTNQQTAGRPSNDRKDSRDLLKRLSRAASESPSPDKDTPSDDLRQNVNQTPQVSKSTSHLKTPVVTGAWIDQTMNEKTQAGISNPMLNTPFVTGGWIDTPLPPGGRGPPMPTPSDDFEREMGAGRVGAADLIKRLSTQANSPRPKLRPQEQLKYTGPPLPKSALENIIKNAKETTSMALPVIPDSEEDPTLQLGESTIQSLEEMIANDTDFSTILAPTPPSQETSPPSSDPSPNAKVGTLNERKASRLADLQSYTQILSRLTSLAPSLRDSKKKIASLENAVAKAPSTLANRVPPTQEQCDEAGEIHDFVLPCPKCGCPGRLETDFGGLMTVRDNLTSIRIPIPRLWRWKKDSWRPHLTWLGVLTIVAWTMVGAEAWARCVFYPRWM